ncbi:MAG: ABC transporter ATP-binding protein [Alphaproteobacteria bacterium]|nr:ABC transporter ATP-binding protein [Alphaproteobacteria bacterium]
MSDANDDVVLRVHDMDVHYGEIPAVLDANLEVRRSEIVCVLGPNGAGKTTLLKAVVGSVKASKGTIEYRIDGGWRDLRRMETHERAPLGIYTVAAVENVMPRFTVEENLEIGAYVRNDKEQIRIDMEAQFERFPILADRRKQLSGTLSGGEQKMLAIARAMMGRPKFLLLDEPSLGLSGKMMDVVFEMIRKINAEHELECLLVEQNVKKGLEVSDRAYVMRIGGIEFEAPSHTLVDGKRIEEAYFGSERAP